MLNLVSGQKEKDRLPGDRSSKQARRSSHGGAILARPSGLLNRCVHWGEGKGANFSPLLTPTSPPPPPHACASQKQQSRDTCGFRETDSSCKFLLASSGGHSGTTISVNRCCVGEPAANTCTLLSHFRGHAIQGKINEVREKIQD